MLPLLPAMLTRKSMHTRLSTVAKQGRLLSSAAAAAPKRAPATKNNNNNDAASTSIPAFDAQAALLAGKKEMKDALDRMEGKMRHLRAGGAEADMLDSLLVVLPGNKKTPMAKLATVAAPSPKQLVVTVMDEAHVVDVCKAISSNPTLNLVPQLASGSTTVINVGIPKTTKEQREARVKLAGEAAEAAKQSIRNIRNQINTKFKHATQFSEDDKKRAEKSLQTMTEAANGKVEEVFKAKEKELLTVSFS